MRLLDLCKSEKSLNGLKFPLRKIVISLCEEGEFAGGNIRIYYGGNGKFYAEYLKGDEIWEIETAEELKEFLEEVKKAEGGLWI